MNKKDLIERSPARIFAQATDGGLKDGEMGLVTAKKGLGKTSVLVQFALDALLNGRPLAHVSFDQHSSNVISWYESVFAEITKKQNASDISETRDEVMRDRTILNFNQETFSLAKVVKTLKALKDGGINIRALVVDGLDMDKVSEADVKAVAEFARDESIVAWFSDTKESDKLSDSCRAALQPFFAAVCHLSPSAAGVELHTLKLRDSKSRPAAIPLDSKTLLMK